MNILKVSGFDQYINVQIFVFYLNGVLFYLHVAFKAYVDIKHTSLYPKILNTYGSLFLLFYYWLNNYTKRDFTIEKQLPHWNNEIQQMSFLLFYAAQMMNTATNLRISANHDEVKGLSPNCEIPKRDCFSVVKSLFIKSEEYYYLG